MPAAIGDQDMECIEDFVVIMYDRTTTTFAVNKARFEMFPRKQRQYNAIPPTRAALLEHKKRTAYQGGHVSGQILNCVQDIPSPEDWGLKIGKLEQRNIIGHKTGQDYRRLQPLVMNC